MNVDKEMVEGIVGDLVSMGCIEQAEIREGVPYYHTTDKGKLVFAFLQTALKYERGAYAYRDN